MTATNVMKFASNSNCAGMLGPIQRQARRKCLQVHPDQYHVPCARLPSAFLSASKAGLESAVGACLKLSPNGDGSGGSHGSIREWDVPRVTDMDNLFSDANLFNGD